LYLSRVRRGIGSFWAAALLLFVLTLFNLHVPPFDLLSAVATAEDEGETKAVVPQGIVPRPIGPQKPTAEGAEENVAVFDFKEVRLYDLLKLFSELTGKNVIANPNIYDLKVTLFLKDLAARDVLDILCRQYGLWYREDENCIHLMTIEDYRKDLVIHFEEKRRVFDLKYAAAAQVANIIVCLLGDRVVLTGFDQEVEDIYSHISGRIELEAEEEARTRPIVVRKAFGIDTEVTRGALERAEEIREKEKAAKKVEAREEKKEGIRIIDIEELLKAKGKGTMAFMTVFMRNNSIILYSADEKIPDEIGELIEALDTPTRQVLLEGKILEITLSDDFSSLFDLSYQSNEMTTRDYPEDITMPRHSGALGRFGNLEGATLLYTFFSKEFEARMELLKKDGRVKTIATPMVLCANNSPAKFFIGEERPIVTNYEFEVREYAERTVETIRAVMNLEEIGTTLEITPLINEDRTVTMEILSEISTVNVGGASMSSVTEAGEVITLPIDTIDTATIESIIVAQDGKKLAIGGLVREEESVLESKVPLLGDIPILGFFFKKYISKMERKETVVLIVPHIMMAAGEARPVSDKMMKALSEHPYVKHDEERLLIYDEESEKLRSTTGPSFAEGIFF